ncbi:hypothetical protein [Streptomyces sp. bgisy060]|uniref:hypothetical protein n=1 Tax=Streptomyces sp. bgisy060 TaxID=3413775 RepID=UPI003EBD3A0C
MSSDSHIVPVLAEGITDRAFRLYCFLALKTRGEWVTVQEVADACALTNHEARKPLSDLRRANMAESRRVYELGNHGRKTWHTRFRTVQDQMSGAAA